MIRLLGLCLPPARLLLSRSGRQIHNEVRELVRVARALGVLGHHVTLQVIPAMNREPAFQASPGVRYRSEDRRTQQSSSSSYISQAYGLGGFERDATRKCNRDGP